MVKIKSGVVPETVTSRKAMEGKKVENKAVQVSEYFAETSGMHGIGHIAERGKLFGSIWAIICAASFAMLIYQVVAAVQNYYSYPVITWVQSRVKDKLIYPAITFCNEAPVTGQKDRIFNDSSFLDQNISLPLRLLYETMIKYNNVTKNKTEEAEDDFFDNIEYDGKTLDLKTLMNSIPLHEKSLLGFRLEDMLLKCTHSHHDCSEMDFVNFTNYKYGNCYTFNAAVPDKPPLIAQRGGTESGLDLQLLIRQYDYVHLNTLSAGIRLVVHDQSTMPFPENQGVYLSPGFNTGITVTKTKSNNYPPPYTQCLEEDEQLQKWETTQNIFNSLLPGMKYDQVACLQSEYQRDVVKECKCYDPSYPTPQEATGEIPPSCKILWKNTTDCFNKFWEKFMDSSKYTNHCLPLCQDTDFILSTSEAFWPATESMKYVNKRLKHKFPDFARLIKGMPEEYQYTVMRNNILRVQIYYKDTTYQLSVTKPKYTTSDLLSSIGSQISLWLGMSIISGFEIAEYLIRLWLLLFTKRDNKNITVIEKK